MGPTHSHKVDTSFLELPIEIDGGGTANNFLVYQPQQGFFDGQTISVFYDSDTGTLNAGIKPDNYFSGSTQSTITNPVDNKFTDGLFGKIASICTEEKIISQAKVIINLLDKHTSSLQELNLPTFSVSMPEDDEVLLTWKSENIRIGIAIDRIMKDSSWYVSSNIGYKGLSGSDYFGSDRDKDISLLIDTFLRAFNEYK